LKDIKNRAEKEPVPFQASINAETRSMLPRRTGADVTDGWRGCQ
jgi:hypothetical protein